MSSWRDCFSSRAHAKNSTYGGSYPFAHDDPEINFNSSWFKRWDLSEPQQEQQQETQQTYQPHSEHNHEHEDHTYETYQPDEEHEAPTHQPKSSSWLKEWLESPSGEEYVRRNCTTYDYSENKTTDYHQYQEPEDYHQENESQESYKLEKNIINTSPAFRKRTTKDAISFKKKVRENVNQTLSPDYYSSASSSYRRSRFGDETEDVFYDAEEEDEEDVDVFFNSTQCFLD